MCWSKCPNEEKKGTAFALSRNIGADRCEEEVTRTVIGSLNIATHTSAHLCKFLSFCQTLKTN